MNRTESLPMVALRGMTILPEMVAHFDISRERSIEAVQEAMARSRHPVRQVLIQRNRAS